MNHIEKYEVWHMEYTDNRDRCIALAEYIIENGSTVRATAERFGISKSTVHKDITAGLQKRNKRLADQVKKVLEKNKLERHLRGGEATRIKYLKAKKQKTKI